MPRGVGGPGSAQGPSNDGGQVQKGQMGSHTVTKGSHLGTTAKVQQLNMSPGIWATGSVGNRSVEVLDNEKKAILSKGETLLAALKNPMDPKSFPRLAKDVKTFLESVKYFEKEYERTKESKAESKNLFSRAIYKAKRAVLQGGGKTTGQVLANMHQEIEGALRAQQNQYVSHLTGGKETSGNKIKSDCTAFSHRGVQSEQDYNKAKTLLGLLENYQGFTQGQKYTISGDIDMLERMIKRYEEVQQAQTSGGGGAKPSTPPSRTTQQPSALPKAAGGKAAAAASAAPPSKAPSAKPVPGLPNGKGVLKNVCYMNSITQQIANIPQMEELVASARPQDPLGQALQRDLLNLVGVMKRGGSEIDVYEASAKYWQTYQENLKEHPGLGLKAGVNKSNDTVEYLQYLGKRLGVDEFDEGQSMASFPLLIGEGFPTSAKGNPKVIMPSFPEVQEMGYQPPEQITVNGKKYTLQGIINKPKGRLTSGEIVETHHFTSTTKTRDGKWVNQDDAVVSGTVSPEERDTYGVLVMFYVREED